MLLHDNDILWALKHKLLKKGFKVQVFDNYTIIVSVYIKKKGICENGGVMCVRITCSVDRYVRMHVVFLY